MFMSLCLVVLALAGGLTQEKTSFVMPTFRSVKIEGYSYCSIARGKICLTTNDFTKVKKSFQSSVMKFHKALEIFAEDFGIK